MTGPRWRRGHRLHANPQADVQDEFAFHLEQRREELIAQGFSEAEAHELALQRFGDLAGAAALCSDIDSRSLRRVRWSERIMSLARDVPYALRVMRRSPGFTLAAIATVALGIGANTVVFSLLNALLLQPLDAVRPAELVRVYTSESHGLRNESDRFGGSSYADYVDLRASRTLAGLAVFTPFSASVQAGDAALRFEASIVSENYFALLGRPLHMGGWPAGEASSGVIVSYRLWQTTLGSDPAVLGRSLTVNGRPVSIVGVTARDFRGIEPRDIDVYFPFGAAPAFTRRPGALADRGERISHLIGRLGRGETPQSAEQALNGIMQGIAATLPGSNANRVISVRPARSIVPLELTGRAVLSTAALVFAATLVMLALSGVNIAAVLLARTIRRRRELAVRRSLGASPLRLVRQLLTESIVLALASGIVVIGLVSLLPRLASALGVPLSIQPTVDSTVLGYAVAVALVFGVLFGLAPAFAGMRSNVVESLRDGAATVRPAKARAQRILVGCQVALSMLLLVVSAALLASVNRQQQVDPGFPAGGLIVAAFEDPSATYNPAGERALATLAVQRLGNLPGVTSVSTASMAPFTSDGVRSTIHIPGYAAGADENMDVAQIAAGPDFFKTLGIPLLSGRELERDVSDTLRYVVVNRLMARRYWGERNPVGSFVHPGGRRAAPAEVIAVADDARFLSLAEAPQPMYFVQQAGGAGQTVLVRTRGDASALLLAIRGAMSRNDVPAVLVRLRTMEELLRASLAVTRAITHALLTMGILAVLLAAVGLYGVVSHVMAGRTREFGVRLALGASPASITRLALGYGLRLALIGGLAGMVLGLVALRLMAGLIFGSWSSMSASVGAGLLLSLVMLIACALPALRATATAPATALRSD